MAIYIGKHLGNGWGVGTRLKDKDLLGCILFIIFSIIFLIFLALKHINYTIPIIIILIIIYIFHKKRKEKLKNNQVLFEYAKKLFPLIEKVNTLKTVNGRLNNIGLALNLIKQVKSIKNYEAVFIDIDNVEQLLEALQKTLLIEEYIEKAEKSKFKNNKKTELNNLLDAIYLCKENNVKNQDFKICNIKYNNGNLVTIESLKKRAAELGWNDEK